MRMEYAGNDEQTHVHGQHKRSKSASATNSNHAFRVSHPGLHSPLQESSSNKDTDVASNQRDSLQNDIEQLQMRLQPEKSVQMLLERALGRTSSTLSPGHRHSANQTKELIAEIQLLEEEVQNREQHVLSLYRTIFEQCVSRPSSAQVSVLTSPAHAITKKESRKHPTIVSNAFCSSKSFPFRKFHAINTPAKANLLHSTTKNASLSGSKVNNHFESCSKDTKIKGSRFATDKQLTLKDHLYQCPSRLSEEMVKCMAAAYCWINRSSSTGSEHKKSASLSRFSTNRDNCKSTVEISWISTDKNNFSRASYAINSYRLLVEQLEKLNLSNMETNAQTAFWINIYNSMIMHAYLAYGIPHNSLRRLALFHKAAYKIGGHMISANAIEQAIFRFRTPRVGKWLETILSTTMWKKSGEERQRISTKFGLKCHRPLLCFALCTRTLSDPTLKVYTPSNVIEELELATREFLESNIIVKKSKKVFIPKLLDRFGKEAHISQDNLLKWITENVDKKLCDSIQKCVEHKISKKMSQIIEWLPYNSRFRYVFSEVLTEKPWWL
ncbi:uncharacterized protein LOC143596107 isoform X2 [Bidens hawaiensis]|uniref:uncharacterized protein LOC143596107 isoform X2 n=1 Tax=Bidens hawaiensis TaxID=980011 RepID=UPI00404A1FB9